MGYEVMSIATSVPTEVFWFGRFAGMWMAGLGTACAIACGVLVARSVPYVRMPRLHPARLVEAPALR